jgi:hypothetical protein
VFLLSVIGAIASVGLPVYVTSAAYAWWSLRGPGIQLFGHALDFKGGGAGNIRVRVVHDALAVGTPA